MAKPCLSGLYLNGAGWLFYRKTTQPCSITHLPGAIGAGRGPPAGRCCAFVGVWTMNCNAVDQDIRRTGRDGGHPLARLVHGLTRRLVLRQGLFKGPSCRPSSQGGLDGCRRTLSTAKRLMPALAVHLAGKPLASRELFRKPNE